jgi:hypothetical protein
MFGGNTKQSNVEKPFLIKILNSKSPEFENSPSFFLYYFVSFAGKLLEDFHFSKRPDLLPMARRWVSFSRKLCNSFLFSWVGGVLYVTFFLISIKYSFFFDVI